MDFGVDDFYSVGAIACVIGNTVVKDAPEEWKLVIEEIHVLLQCIDLFQEEVKNPNSTLVRSGKERAKAVKNELGRVEVTLKALEKHAKMLEKLGNPERPTIFKWWDKLSSWKSKAADTKEIAVLQNKLVYHNAMLNQLLTLWGNSSQQRIESSRLKLQSERYSSLSLIENPAFGRSIFALAARNREEVLQRGISAMKVEEWNRASELWLRSNTSSSSPLPMSTPQQLKITDGQIRRRPPPPQQIHPSRRRPGVYTRPEPSPVSASGPESITVTVSSPTSTSVSSPVTAMSSPVTVSSSQSSPVPGPRPRQILTIIPNASPTGMGCGSDACKNPRCQYIRR